MSTKDKVLKADLALLGVTVVWGASFPITAIALKHIMPYTLLCARYLLAGIALAIVFFSKLKNVDKRTLKMGILLGVCVAAGSGFQIVGLVYTTPSKSGFITGLSVVIVPMILALIYKKLPGLRTVIGIILSLVGLVFLSMSGGTGINKGDLLTMISAMAFALQIVLVDRYCIDVNLAAFTCIEMLTAGLMGAVPAIMFENMQAAINVESLGAVFFLAVFCTIGGFGIQNKMQPYTEPEHAAIIFLAEPVFSAIFSLFIGDELSGNTLIGCLFIFLGLIVINVKSTRIKLD